MHAVCLACRSQSTLSLLAMIAACRRWRRYNVRERPAVRDGGRFNVASQGLSKSLPSQQICQSVYEGGSAGRNVPGKSGLRPAHQEDVGMRLLRRSGRPGRERPGGRADAGAKRARAWGSARPFRHRVVARTVLPPHGSQGPRRARRTPMAARMHAPALYGPCLHTNKSNPYRTVKSCSLGWRKEIKAPDQSRKPRVAGRRPAHPYPVAMETVHLAPDAQVNLYPRKDTPDEIPQGAPHSCVPSFAATAEVAAR